MRLLPGWESPPNLFPTRKRNKRPLPQKPPYLESEFVSLPWQNDYRSPEIIRPVPDASTLGVFRNEKLKVQVTARGEYRVIRIYALNLLPTESIRRASAILKSAAQHNTQPQLNATGGFCTHIRPDLARNAASEVFETLSADPPAESLVMAGKASARGGELPAGERAASKKSRHHRTTGRKRPGRVQR